MGTVDRYQDGLAEQKMFERAREVVGGLSDQDLIDIRHEFQYGIAYHIVAFTRASGRLADKDHVKEQETILTELIRASMGATDALSNSPVSGFVRTEIMQRRSRGTSFEGVDSADLEMKSLVDAAGDIINQQDPILRVPGKVSEDDTPTNFKLASMLAQSKLGALGIRRVFELVTDEQSLMDAFLAKWDKKPQKSKVNF